MKLQEIKVGVPVIYYAVILDNGKKIKPMATEITSEAWQMNSGEIVCKVKNVSGGVSIEHLEIREIKKMPHPQISKFVKMYVGLSEDWFLKNIVCLSDFTNDSLFNLSFTLASTNPNEFFADNYRVANYFFNVSLTLKDFETLKIAIAHEVLRRGYADMREFGKKTAGNFYGDFETLQALNDRQPLELWYE